jgi:Rps23 Pro-64 3,4-dihydroxylase Tpa1-like proline 4-hydroxylase
MKLTEAKNKLHKIGYCEFNLQDFDDKSISVLEKIKYKVTDLEYPKKFKRLRFDYHGEEIVQSSEEYDTHDLSNIKKIDLLKKYDESGIDQIWLQCDANFPDDSFSKDITKIFYSILEYFYGKTDIDVNMGTQWTLYNEGCFLKDHNDGQGEEYQNTCAILIYLNEEWQEEWGGNLILRNTKNTMDKEVAHKVIPKFGTVAIIDLETFDTSHAVEKVIGEHNRFTILSFATSKTKREKKVL